MMQKSQIRQFVYRFLKIVIVSQKGDFFIFSKQMSYFSLKVLYECLYSVKVEKHA
jgi:hypothetical protein